MFLPVYDDRYIKTKRLNGDKVYTNFRGLNLPENDIECKTFCHCLALKNMMPFTIELDIL